MYLNLPKKLKKFYPYKHLKLSKTLGNKRFDQLYFIYLEIKKFHRFLNRKFNLKQKLFLIYVHKRLVQQCRMFEHNNNLVVLYLKNDENYKK